MLILFSSQFLLGNKDNLAYAKIRGRNLTWTTPSGGSELHIYVKSHVH